MVERSSKFTVLRRSGEVRSELERRRSRFLTVLRRADSSEAAQQVLEDLRSQYPAARHYCSAFMFGADRELQRAHDDGEPSGTAGAPMLEALSKAQMPSGGQDLSDVVAVVVRWFGGALLGAGGLVSAYSDSVIQAIEQARITGVFRTRQRMRRFILPVPIAQAGRWHHQLLLWDVTVHDADYSRHPGLAEFAVSVPDDCEPIQQFHARISAFSAGELEPESSGALWCDRG